MLLQHRSTLVVLIQKLDRLIHLVRLTDALRINCIAFVLRPTLFVFGVHNFYFIEVMVEMRIDVSLVVGEVSCGVYVVMVYNVFNLNEFF